MLKKIQFLLDKLFFPIRSFTPVLNMLANLMLAATWATVFCLIFIEDSGNMVRIWIALAAFAILIFFAEKESQEAFEEETDVAVAAAVEEALREAREEVTIVQDSPVS